MATINQNQYCTVKELYGKGMSARQISEQLNVTIDAVYYFLRKNNILRRTRSETNRIIFERKEKTFRKKEILSTSEEKLFIAGLMLYWGEGSKWEGENRVDFANSNPDMIHIFLSFLRIIYRIEESKLRVFIYCYSNQKEEELIEFWSKKTDIPKRQFTKPYIEKGLDSKNGKMKYGLAHIRYSDKKLLDLIIKEIENNSDKLKRVGTKVVKWV